MKELYKVTLNGQTIQTTEIIQEALALIINCYKATNEPINLVLTEDGEEIVTFIRRLKDE